MADFSKGCQELSNSLRRTNGWRDMLDGLKGEMSDLGVAYIYVGRGFSANLRVKYILTFSYCRRGQGGGLGIVCSLHPASSVCHGTILLAMRRIPNCRNIEKTTKRPASRSVTLFETRRCRVGTLFPPKSTITSCASFAKTLSRNTLPLGPTHTITIVGYLYPSFVSLLHLHVYDTSPQQ